MKPLKWTQLEYFAAIARLQHMSRAAAQLGVSQPALSRALATLEAELAVPLFDRVGRSIRLTRYGELFQKRVARALREIDDGRAELADMVGSKHGTVALGFLRSLGIRFVPQLVRNFSSFNEGVRFSFVQSNNAALEEQLLSGDLDLILNTTSLNKSAFEWRLVANQELVLIVSRSDPLARKRHIDLSELANRPFVTLKQGNFRRLTEQLCHKAGFAPKIRFEADDSSSVPGFVSAGFGIAIVSPDSAEDSEVTALRISRPKANRMIGVAWPRDKYLSACARSFRDFAISQGRVFLRASHHDRN
jgi:LysR family transcriptional activator of glutamate synthase operon